MPVIIGVDPHKATHTAVVLDDNEVELAHLQVRASSAQLKRLLAWAAPFEQRTWAVEGAGGCGYLLSQQLVAAGETVLNVPATLAARVRVLGSGRSNKNDPNDARSVAIAALRAPGLEKVRPADHASVLRLLAKRNSQLSSTRTRTACRLHALLAELVEGGLANKLKASQAERVLASLTPTTAVQLARHALALEHLEDLRRVDAQIAASKRRIIEAVNASGTTVTDVVGVGAVVAAMVIGYTGDVRRFPSRNHYAAYTGTAPIEMSSGGRVIHRLSRRGNRQLNHAMHLAALSQIRYPTPRAGRTTTARSPRERRTRRPFGLSSAASATLSTASCSPAPRAERGPGRATRGDSRVQRDRLYTLTAGSSDQPLPDPAKP